MNTTDFLIAQTFRRLCVISLLAVAALSAGCSNFSDREGYWNAQFAGWLKGADVYRVTSFANANGHEVHCDDAVRVRPIDPPPNPTGQCYYVDAKSKGALFNHRGRLFVMMKMVDGRVDSYSFTRTLVVM